MRSKPFEAIISDMDGVLTRTAQVHERAWKRLFDSFLQKQGQKPFSGADYRAYVDGKPRYDGVADFLSSRGIELPRGEPSDGPEKETICGLGNRKNQMFLEMLDREGVGVFEDAVAALARWRRGGMRIAVVSGSRNCHRVLRSAKLEDRVDEIVDGKLAEELGLDGKFGIMLEAARRLAVRPADAVVLEDATAGVRAARRAEFGLVLGVSRDEHEHNLSEAGAHEVVRNVSRARFPRRIPNVRERSEELSEWWGSRSLALFLDFDGTLSPIVKDPKDATMPEETREALKKLAQCCPVAIISGRDRQDVEQRVGMPHLLYAGDHGLDIAGPGQQKIFPEAEEALVDVNRAERELRQRLAQIPGVIIERKRFSVAVHYRQVGDDSIVGEIARIVELVHAGTRLRKRHGKKVLELEPAVDWDKGHALRWLMDVLRVEPQRSFAMYIGDDETDEDAFAALAGDGAGVRVGDEVTTSLADYRVDSPAEVRELLAWLVLRTREKAGVEHIGKER